MFISMFNKIQNDIHIPQVLYLNFVLYKWTTGNSKNLMFILITAHSNHRVTQRVHTRFQIYNKCLYHLSRVLEI